MTEYIVYRKVEDDQEPKPGSFSWEKVDHPETVGFTGEDTVYRLKSPEGSEGAVVLMTPTKQIPDTVTSAATALKELLTVVEKAKEIDGSCGAEVTDAAVGAFVNTAKMPKILVDQLRIWRALAAVGAAAVLAALGVGIWLIVKLIDKVPENQLTGASMMVTSAPEPRTATPETR